MPTLIGAWRGRAGRPGRAAAGWAVLVCCVWLLRTGPSLSAAPPIAQDPTSRLEKLERERRTEAVRRGAGIFARACAACHGRGGRGDGPGAADLDPPPRDLTRGRYRFRTTASGELPRPEDLARTIRQGLPGSSMPGFGRLFSSEETSDLIAFVYSLRPGAEGDPPLPEPLSVAPLPPSTPTMIRDGRALYLVLGCGSCHGMDGSGRGPAAPGLTDDEGRRLTRTRSVFATTNRSTDFRYDPLKGGAEPSDIVRTLRTGLNGAPMPSYDAAMVFAAEEVDPSSLPPGVTEADRAAVEEFRRASPSRAALARMGDERLDELRDRRMAALAYYVASLKRRPGVWRALFVAEPELAPRVFNATDATKEQRGNEDPWDD